MGDAVYWLAVALDYDEDRARALSIAGAIVRNHRRGLGIESARMGDYPDDWPDEKLIWTALIGVAAAGKGSVVPYMHLRTAEAALRTIWRRGQS